MIYCWIQEFHNSINLIYLKKNTNSLVFYLTSCLVAENDFTSLNAAIADLSIYTVDSKFNSTFNSSKLLIILEESNSIKLYA